MRFFTFSWGKNYIAVRGLLRVLGHELADPLPVSSTVIRKGVELSPPFVCFSGKVVLGQLIGQIERGERHFLWMSSLGIEACRCADTGSFLEALVKKHFPGLRTYRMGGNSRTESLVTMRSHFPDVSRLKHDYAYFIFFMKLELIHMIEGKCLEMRSMAHHPSEARRLEKEFIGLVDRYNDPIRLFFTGMRFHSKIIRLKQQKDAPRVRIGIIGGEHILSELDSIMAKIKGIAEKGFHLQWRSGFRLIARTSDGDHPLRGRESLPFMKDYVKEYFHSHTWGTELFSCVHALEFAEESYDGIIHIYSFGCLPQIAVKPAIQKISKDRGIPILSLPVGDKFNESGIETRLEAFIDLINEKKNTSMRSNDG